MTDQQFSGHTTYGTLGGIITIVLANIQAGDLLKTMVDELGATVTDINITDLNDDVFYARIGVTRADGEHVDIDARPSDAIGLAVRTEAPIFVDEEVLDQAAHTLPTESDDKLEVYRDFVNQLFQEGERHPDA